MSATKPEPSTAGEWFAQIASEYDSLIRRAVPGYEDMTRLLSESLPATASSVLELGCGTGNFSLALVARYPSAELTVVDAAQEMIDVTRGRIGAADRTFASRTRFITARFEELPLEPAAYDVVTSCISLHHVQDKAPVFGAIGRTLKPGGRFCFADQMRAAPQTLHWSNWEAWLAFCREPGNCTEAEVEQLVQHATAHDHYETVAQHLRVLEHAGFTELDCVWRNGMWAIVTASR